MVYMCVYSVCYVYMCGVCVWDEDDVCASGVCVCCVVCAGWCAVCVVGMCMIYTSVLCYVCAVGGDVCGMYASVV